MNAIELLAPLVDQIDLPEAPAEGICCVLGTQEPCINRKHVIKTTFTNLDLLRAPESPVASVRAYQVMNCDLQRKSSWYCTQSEFRPIDRKSVRDVVLSAEYVPPWAGYVTTSYKKHGAIRAPVNSARQAVWLFESVKVDCSSHAQVMEYWRIMSELRISGIPRPAMETLDFGAHLLSKRYKDLMAYDRWARPKYQSPLYQFVCYLLPSEEEIKGGLDAEQDQPELL